VLEDAVGTTLDRGAQHFGKRRGAWLDKVRREDQRNPHLARLIARTRCASDGFNRHSENVDRLLLLHRTEKHGKRLREESTCESGEPSCLCFRFAVLRTFR
tara:strand:+ start:1667 stop:1969 length:303 start_codon:yes stop_codon:yes gene_type:complete